MFSISRLISEKVKNFYCQLGEQTGIGATRHLLRICGLNILIDDGIAISRKGNVQIQGRPFGEDLQGVRIDIIIITHAHIDHMGDIARFVKYHLESWIFISAEALEATIYMLYDSLKIMTENAQLAENLGEPIPEIMFDKDDIEALANSEKLVVIEKDMKKLSHPDFPGFKFVFANSGHDVGAKMVKIIDPNGQTYLITGDVASHDQETCSGAMNPLGQCDVMITEATNGSKPMIETRAQTWVKVGNLLEKVSAREGLAMFASFMKNRSANMALGLAKLGFVPVIDGSARIMMRIELGNEKVQDLLDKKEIIFIDEVRDNPKIAWDQRKALLSGELGFHPIIAPSGTMEQGFANFYGHQLLPDRKNAVIFPGYVFPDSVSKQILEIARGRTVNLNVFQKGRGYVPTPTNVLADVYHLDGFSAHDYQQGLVERVVLTKPKLLIVHHTDPKTFPVFVAAVEARYTELDLPLPKFVHGSHLHMFEF